MLFGKVNKNSDPDVQNIGESINLLEKELKAYERGNYELAGKYHEAIAIRCEAADAMRGDFTGVRDWIAKLFRPLITSKNE